MKTLFLSVLSLLFFVSVSFTAQYKRIISLAPSVTQSLYELGADKEVIGITVFCPKGAGKKEVIGTLLEPDFEKIVSLKPDLIISTKEGNNKSAVEKLMRLGFEVYVMETAESFSEISGTFYDLSVKLDKQEKSNKIIEDAQKLIKNTTEKIPSGKDEKVFWEVGAKPLYTAARLSYVNDYNLYTKTINIYKDVNARYPQIDVEDVAARNPDIIILVNMGDINESEITGWKKYSTMKAVRNGRIYMIDVDDIFTPTPSTFAKGVEVIAGTIYPEIFGAK